MTDFLFYLNRSVELQSSLFWTLGIVGIYAGCGWVIFK